MKDIMRTTMSIADELLAAAKREARTRGLTLGQMVEEALRRELNRPRPDSELPELPVFTRGDGPRPGVDLTSNRALHELLDEGVGPDRRR